jgi:hypothetical protein
MSTLPPAIAITSIGPRPYASGTVTVSPTATLISHVPSAHGPDGEGDGVAVCVGPDADVDPDLLDRLSAGDPSEESEEQDVRTANTQAATAATVAVDDVPLRIMIAIEPPPPAARAVHPKNVPGGVCP